MGRAVRKATGPNAAKPHGRLRTATGGIPDPKKTIEILRSWREGDEREQKETFEFLERALDEDRLPRHH